MFIILSKNHPLLYNNPSGDAFMSIQNWNAKDYATQSSAQLKWAKELIEKINIQGTESILDIGCGDGKITALLAETCSEGRVIGIDSSQSMINEAESSFVHEKFPNLSFQVMDASNLIFNEAFDFIFSNSALHWIKDHSPVLSGIYHALKPSGKLYLKFGGKGTLDAFQPMINNMLSNSKWETYFKTFEPTWGFFDDQTYTQWLKDKGLTPISVRLVPSDMVHENRHGLEGWVRTTWHPYLTFIPENLKNTFVTELVDRYLEQNPVDSDGRTHVDMVRLEVEATKGK